MTLRYFFCLILMCTPVFASDLFPFVLPWDDNSANFTNLSSWNSKPAGKQGFVRVEGSHLLSGDERIRLLGVNIVFGSTSPTHEEADKIAARLARFGVNIVRFHHMDTNASPNGLLLKDGKTIDVAQLERFDYFVAALKREGIYSNINLHVGRKYPSMTHWGESTPKYWKGVDLFYPPMIALQKDFARELLQHRNPYTGTRYVDESAVALVEINNENGLLRVWREGQFDQMSEPYSSELQRQWQSWLRARYGSTAALSQAWGVQNEALGAEMLGNRINVKSNDVGWGVQLIAGAQAALSRKDDGSLQLAMQQVGNESWHTQLHQNGLQLKADQPYTLTLRLRADRPLKLGVTAMQAHAPWQRLWSQDLNVGKEWQTWKITFSPTQSDSVARLTLTGLGLQRGNLWIDSASLKSGGLLGLADDEKLENGSVQISSSADFQRRTVAGQRDWVRFLWDTEVAYWRDMRQYLKVELGVKMPVIGTQVSYSPAPIQAEMDVVDGHAYWQHPRFPGKPFDPDNWSIQNTPMAGASNPDALLGLARRRIAGKPFIVTEYNHSSPSFYQGEALPLAAAYGAMQGWDGLFLYSYGKHNKEWDAGFINNYFDSHANPVKMISLISAAALLRRGDVATAELPAQTLPDTAHWVDKLRAGYQMPAAETALSAALIEPIGLGSTGATEHPLPVRSRSGELVWDKTTTINTALSKGVIGNKAGKVMLSGVGFELLKARNDWGVLLATVLEGKGFNGPAKILLSALGQMENTEQKWLDAKQTTLGRNWGKAPLLAEGLAARLTLPVPAERVKAWALDERGNRREIIPVSGGKQAFFEISEHYRTLWYEVEIK